MRRKKRQTNNSGLAKKLVFPSIFILMFLSALRYSANFILLKDIYCRSQYGECSALILAKLSRIKGEKLIGSFANVKKILGSEPLVEKFNMQYIPLSGIKINLIERRPEYAMADKSAAVFAVVDSDGILTEFVDSTELPILEVENLPKEKGKKILPQELFALNLVSYINKTFQIKKGILKKDQLDIELKPGLTVIFPLSGDKEVLVGSLILIYNDLKNTNSDLGKKADLVNTIDLRFKNPVIKTVSLEGLE